MIKIRHVAAAYRRWNEDHAGMMAAAIAYYLSLSLLPTLLLIASGFGFFLKWTDSGVEARSYLLRIVQEQANETLAESLHHMLLDVEQMAVYSGPLGIVTLLMASLAIFAQLDRAFDRIYRVPSQTHGNPLAMAGAVLTYRLRAFGMLVSLGFVVIAIFVAGLAFTWFHDHATTVAPRLLQLWWLMETLIECGLNSVVFALIYRWVPRVPVRWRHAFVGGVAAALLWEVGRQFLGSFFIGERYTSAYGMIGAMTGLMLWGYGGIAVLLAGAELSQVLAAESNDVPLVVSRTKSPKPSFAFRNATWFHAYDFIFAAIVIYFASFFVFQAFRCRTIPSQTPNSAQQVVIFSKQPKIQDAACLIYSPLIRFMPAHRSFPSGEQVAELVASSADPETMTR